MTYQYRPKAADEAGKRKLQPSQKQGIVWRKAIDGRVDAEHFVMIFQQLTILSVFNDIHILKLSPHLSPTTLYLRQTTDF